MRLRLPGCQLWHLVELNEFWRFKTPGEDQLEQPSQTKSKTSIVGHEHPRFYRKSSLSENTPTKITASYAENPTKRGHAHARSRKFGWMLQNATLDLEYCLQCAPVSIDQLWPEQYPNPGVYGHIAHVARGTGYKMLQDVSGRLIETRHKTLCRFCCQPQSSMTCLLFVFNSLNSSRATE